MSQNLQSFIPIYDQVPDEWEDAKPFFVEALKRISYAVNLREIGLFIEQETITGMQFIPGVNATPETNPGGNRAVMRNVYDFGPLLNATPKTLAHNITYDSNFSLVNLWLSASDSTNLTSFSLQYYTTGAADIKIYLTQTNIVVDMTGNYSTYDRSFVVVEYMQNI